MEKKEIEKQNRIGEKGVNWSAAGRATPVDQQAAK